MKIGLNGLSKKDGSISTGEISMMRKLIKYQGVCIGWWGAMGNLGILDSLACIMFPMANGYISTWGSVCLIHISCSPYFHISRQFLFLFAYLSPYQWFHISKNLLLGWWLLVNQQSRFVSEGSVVWKYNLCKVLISSCGLQKWCFAVWKVHFMRIDSCCEATWMCGRPKNWLHCVNAIIFLQGRQSTVQVFIIWHWSHSATYSQRWFGTLWLTVSFSQHHLCVASTLSI